VSTAASTAERQLAVKVLTPEGAVFEGNVRMVIAPSVEGEIGILPRHMPVVALLRPGETRLRITDGEDVILATTAGYMSVEFDTVVILVEQAEPYDQIDRARAEAALARAREELAAAGDDEIAADRAQAAVHRAENRLKVIDRNA
jgi:F-type H+-transporting ATPase subunit epsilon